MGQAHRIFLEMLKKETNGCIVWPYRKAGRGYGSVGLGGGTAAEYRREYAHRLAYIVTHGSIPNGLDVLHHCDNPPCFNPRHLFAGTNQDNRDDQRSKGRTCIGTKNGQARLTEDQVREIRTLYQKNVFRCGQTALGKKFGVHRIAIRKIVRGETWKHLL
jgi:hypothetical protein